MTPDLTPIVLEVEQRCRPGGLVSLFLDFDGTLVPIASDPSVPVLDPETRETLRSLSTKQGMVTTIISGRALEDVYDRIRLDGLIYAGNHGLEIFGRNLCFVEPAASALREELGQLSDDLAVELETIAGASVEQKGLTTSVHYRHVSPAEIADVRDAVREAVEADGPFRATPGRKVFNIVPRTDWHKGTAARWINRRLGRDKDIVSIFFGDDATDEDAFNTLTGAITVKVGCCPTKAKYRVPGPETVHEFLYWLADFEPQ